MEPLRLHLKTISAQGTLIMMVARDADGNRFTVHVPDFRPYFYVEQTPENLKTLRKRGMEFEEGKPTLFGKRTYRVYVDTPGSVPKRRKGFEGEDASSYEADVPYTRRFLVDTGIHDGFELDDYKRIGDAVILASKDAIKPVSFRTKDRQFQYDIETNKPEGSKHYSPPTEAKGAVTALTFHDNFDEAVYQTYYWHPERGTPGRPMLELRNQWSDAYEREVPWHIHTFGTEEEFLVAVLRYLKATRPDAMQAWNGHQGHHRKNFGGFDAPYLINRLRRIGISPGQLSPLGSAHAGWKVFGKETTETSNGKFQCHIDGVQLIDSMTTYQIKEGGFTAQVPFSDLKRVCEKFTERARPGRGKKLKKDPSAIEDWWLNNTEQFLKYSFDDVDALVFLEMSEGYLEFARDMQQFVGCEDANKLFTPMSLIDSMLLRIAKEDGVCVPTSESEDDDYMAEGGFVLPPEVKGLQRRVGVLDLTTMYVHIIISGNLSPETHVPNPTEDQVKDLICVPSDLGPQFFLKPEVKVGLLPKTALRFKAVREKYDALIEKAETAAQVKLLKHQRQPAKQLLLGVWGTSLSRYFRLFKPEVGSSITGTGRYIIQNTRDFVRSKGDRVTYVDTDSNFVPLPGDDNIPRDERSVQHGEALAGMINVFFDSLAASMNMDKHGFEIGLETIYDPFVMGEGKKMYAGYIVWSEGKWQDEPEFMAAGVQAIKSDAAPITRESGMALLKAILNGATPMEIQHYVRTIYEGVLGGDVPIDDIIKAVGLGADPESPKAPNTYIVNGCRYGKAMYDFEYVVGAKVRAVRLKGSDETWISIPDGEDLPANLQLDLQYHADLTILKPLRNILEWVDLAQIVDSIEHGTVATVQRRL